MKAVQIREYGGREVLQFTEQAPKPTPAHGQVLVEVQAASLNPIDWKLRAGSLKEHVPLTMPATLGVDCCGIVSQVAESESGLTIGDRVYGYASVFAGGSGSFAEYATANASALALAPQRVSVVEAAAAPLVGISALQALEEHIKLQRGQKILIHGGAGGIGSVAIQIAKWIRAYVATTAGGDDRRYVEELGADEVIDYKKEAFEERPADFDAVFDTVGGSTTEKSFRVLKKGGTLVSMLGLPDAALPQQHGVTVIGQVTHVRTALLERLADLLDAKTIAIRIAKILPLDKAQEAFQLAEEGHARGKVVFEIKRG